MKDYYKTLQVSPDASEDQIRKAYRSLALKYHPDRNPGDSSAEEQFKEIAEAYGVLVDPGKRAEYDQWLRTGARDRTAGQGFPYSQEEIFRDLFRDPRFSRVFQDLFSEFEKAGFRFDRRFFDQIFFGGRGMFFGGFFIWGPFGSSRMKMQGPRLRSRVPSHDQSQLQPFGLVKRLGQKIGRLLLGAPQPLPKATQEISIQPQDLTYNLTLPTADAQEGSWVTIAIDRGRGQERLKVKVPPGTRSGTRLRLKGKGKRVDDGAGDLYLTINLT